MIGADFSLPVGRGITGLIAEFVIILENAATTVDRQNTEGYLAHKWGLTSIYLIIILTDFLLQKFLDPPSLSTLQPRQHLR